MTLIVGNQTFAHAILKTAQRQGKLQRDANTRRYEWWFPKIDHENELVTSNWAKQNGYTTNDQKLFEHLNIVTRKTEKRTDKQLFSQFNRAVKDAYEQHGHELGRDLPPDYSVPLVVQDFVDSLYLGYTILREHAGDAKLFE